MGFKISIPSIITGVLTVGAAASLSAIVSTLQGKDPIRGFLTPYETLSPIAKAKAASIIAGTGGIGPEGRAPVIQVSQTGSYLYDPGQYFDPLGGYDPWQTATDFFQTSSAGWGGSFLTELTALESSARSRR